MGASLLRSRRGALILPPHPAPVCSCRELVADQEIIKQEIRRRLEKYHVRHPARAFECNECIDGAVVLPLKRGEPPG